MHAYHYAFRQAAAQRFYDNLFNQALEVQCDKARAFNPSMDDNMPARLRGVLKREIDNVARELKISHQAATGKLCEAIIYRGTYSLK